jgi:integrase
MARTFLRPWELRFAEWDEIDYDRALLTIPEARAKGREKVEHLVPLSQQVIKKFRELEKHTGHREYVFETLVRGQPFSENTLNQAMKRMGYDGDTMTPHGYRAMASTLLHEKMMQDWANYLDKLAKE